MGVAVRRACRRARPGSREAGIRRAQPVLHRCARKGLVAADATHAPDGSVQFDHRTAAGLVVQAVDVLGDHGRHPASALERGKDAMAGVGFGTPHGLPACVAARPVAPAHRLRAEEGLVLDRLGMQPFTVRSAVGRQSAARAEAGAGQHRDRPDSQQFDQWKKLVALHLPPVAWPSFKKRQFRTPITSLPRHDLPGMAAPRGRFRARTRWRSSPLRILRHAQALPSTARGGRCKRKGSFDINEERLVRGGSKV